MAGMKLYGAKETPNTGRALAILNELGIDYEFIQLDFFGGEHKKPHYLALNPFGLVPTLVDGDIVLFESRAIGRYLTTHYADEAKQKLINSGNKSESAALQLWLEVEAQQFNPPASALFYESIVKPLRRIPVDGAVVEAQLEKLSSVLDVYEKRLGESKYLAGDDFTLADLNHLPYLYAISRIPQTADVYASRPHLRAWWKELLERPAWKKASAGFPY